MTLNELNVLVSSLPGPLQRMARSCDVTVLLREVPKFNADPAYRADHDKERATDDDKLWGKFDAQVQSGEILPCVAEKVEQIMGRAR